MEKRDKMILWCLLGTVMIFIAGLRVPGATPDSDAYETMYYVGDSSVMGKLVEPSFTLISDVLHSFGLGVNALFFTYALISIPLRMTAIWKLSDIPLFTLGIYISYYYQLHDLVQIRCAVASALFLLAVYYRLEHKSKYAVLCIVSGIFFHFSAAAGFLIFFFNRQSLRSWETVLLYLIVPLGAFYSLSGFDFTQFIPSEIGGDKLQMYRELKDKGLEGEMEGIPFYQDPAILLNICLYYGCLIYHQFLSASNRYVPMFIRIMGVAFLCKFVFGNLSSVLASRLFEYFDVVSIFLWTAAVYAFHPLVAGKATISFATTVRFFLSTLIYVLGLGLSH